MSTWIIAGFWGLVSGLALVIGALFGYYVKVSEKLIALIMGFGSGVLISALSFELMDEAYQKGGFNSTALGFVSGGILFSVANMLVSANGGKHRKRSGDQQPEGSGLAIAIGALLDGIPEAIAIGVSMIQGGAVSVATVIAIFISNVPEGLSSSVGMKKAGKSKLYIFGTWTAIAIITGIGAVVGYTVFSGLSQTVISITLSVAAGAILCMLADTMIPEAFEKGHNWVGIITVLGFLCAFVLSKKG